MSIQNKIINTSLEILPDIENHVENDYILMPFKYDSLVGHILFTAEYTGEGLSWILTEYKANLIVRLKK